MNQQPNAQVGEKIERPLRAGVFESVSQVDAVIEALSNADFTQAEISVLCSDTTREAHFREFEHQRPAGTNAPAAATAGSVIGAAIGGLAAVAGLVTTGGIAVVAAGGIAAWTGGIVGGLIGAMMTRGVEKELANFYDQALTAGKFLVAVEDHGPRHAQRLAAAERIFAAHGSAPVALPEG